MTRLSIAMAMAACAFVVAGCGRFGFDGTSADAIDTPLPALQTVTVPAFNTSGATFVDGLDEECTNVTDAERAIHIVADLTSTALVHATGNCGYQPTYGTMQVLPTQPAHVAVGYSTLNGQAVNYRSSQVLVLGLR